MWKVSHVYKTSITNHANIVMWSVRLRLYCNCTGQCDEVRVVFRDKSARHRNIYLRHSGINCAKLRDEHLGQSWAIYSFLSFSSDVCPCSNTHIPLIQVAPVIAPLDKSDVNNGSFNTPRCSHWRRLDAMPFFLVESVFKSFLFAYPIAADSDEGQ